MNKERWAELLLLLDRACGDVARDSKLQWKVFDTARTLTDQKREETLNKPRSRLKNKQ